MSFLRGGDEFVEVGDDGIGFGFGDADDVGDEARVEEDGFPLGYRVSADEGVFGYCLFVALFSFRLFYCNGCYCSCWRKYVPTGSRRTVRPRAVEPSAWICAECKAERPSR